MEKKEPALNSTTSLYRHFNESSVAQNIFEEHPQNEHLIFLSTQLQVDTPSWHTLAEYGMHHLPKDTDRPDAALAIYFSTLSELQGIPDAVYQFAMEGMVYAKNDVDFPTTTYSEVDAAYKKIVPILT
jgi:hypothetical protein